MDKTICNDCRGGSLEAVLAKVIVLHVQVGQLRCYSMLYYASHAAMGEDGTIVSIEWNIATTNKGTCQHYCVGGSYNPISVMSLCPDNTWKFTNTSESSSCKECPEGEYSSTSASSCISCTKEN